MAKIAGCDALEELNREIIETVKFRFIEKEIIGKRPDRNTLHGMLDLKQLQEQEFFTFTNMKKNITVSGLDYNLAALGSFHNSELSFNKPG